MRPNKAKRILQTLRRISYFLIPVFLIILLFRRIDLPRLIEAAGSVDPGWLGLTLLLYPLSLWLGAVRWYALLNWFGNAPIPLRFALTQQWAGYAVGLFTPGYTGWDLYRIIQGGKAAGAYRSGLLILLLERSTALAAAMGFLLFSSTRLDREAVSSFSWIPLSATVLLVFSLLFIGLLYWENGRLAYALVARCKRWIAPKSDVPKTILPLREALPFRRLGVLFALSALIQAFSILTNWLLFQAIQHPVPLVTVAFVTPAALVIVLVPVSFGGVGIREFTYLYLYRPFGVSPEHAVLVSLLNLMGLLVNGIIGGLVWLHKAIQGERASGS